MHIFMLIILSCILYLYVFGATANQTFLKLQSIFDDQ